MPDELSGAAGPRPRRIVISAARWENSQCLSPHRGKIAAPMSENQVPCISNRIIRSVSVTITHRQGTAP
jgi:hypothetical protein